MSENSDNLDEGQAAGGGDGAAAANAAAAQESWLKSLSEDLQSDPSLTKFTDIESLAKSYVNAQRLIGQDKIPMPQTDEDFMNVYKRLGMPDEVTGYEIEPFEWPEGFKANEDNSAVLERAFELGLSNKQANGLVAFLNENNLNTQKQGRQSFDQMREQAEKSMKEEWGDAMDGNLELAKRVINDYGDDSTKDFFNKTGLGNDANLLRVFGNIGKKLVEDRVLEGHKASGQSPVEIQHQIKTLQANPAYTDRNHPEHKSMIKQAQALFEKAYPA